MRGALAALAVMTALVPLVACAASQPTLAQCPCACGSSSSSGASSAAALAASSASSVSPEAVASSAPPAALPAGVTGNPNDYSPHELAALYVEDAYARVSKRDGAGCLAALAQHDKLDPRHPSTDARHAHVAMIRGQCLMLSGQCTVGRAFVGDVMRNNGNAVGPEQLDKMLDAYVGLFCEGDALTPRERFLRARHRLNIGAFTATHDRAYCMEAFQTMWTLRNTVKPKNDDDVFVKDPLMFLVTAGPSCLVRAGDCDGAFAVYRDVARELYATKPWAMDDTQLRRNFDMMNQRKCQK